MKILSALALGAVVVSSAASASQYPRGDSFYVDISSGYIGKAKAKKNKDSSIETKEAGIEIGGKYFDIGFKSANYRINDRWWNSGEKLKINAKRLYADVKYGDRMSNSSWSYFFSLGAGANYSRGGVKFKKNYQYDASAIMTYDINQDWSVDMGAAASVNKIGILLRPVLNFKYSDEKKHGFSFRLGLPVNQVTYRFNDVIALRGRLAADEQVYGFSRLGKHIYFRDRYAILDAAVIANLGNFYAELGAGYVLGRDTRMYDEKGKKFGEKIKYKKQATAFLNFGYRF